MDYNIFILTPKSESKKMKEEISNPPVLSPSSSHRWRKHDREPFSPVFTLHIPTHIIEGERKADRHDRLLCLYTFCCLCLAGEGLERETEGGNRRSKTACVFQASKICSLPRTRITRKPEQKYSNHPMLLPLSFENCLPAWYFYYY